MRGASLAEQKISNHENRVRELVPTNVTSIIVNMYFADNQTAYTYILMSLISSDIVAQK